uniref:Aquaporin n=1 Tax=Lotharella globosa TaxID=91324 RepID=A0A7S3Z659_9EUKA
MAGEEKTAPEFSLPPWLLTMARPLAMEFIGTFFLCLTIAMNADSSLAPLGVGGVLIAMVFMGGKVSGAHYNPAVTLAVALCGKIDWVKAGFYVIAQVAASFVAGIVGAIVAGSLGRPAGYPTVSATSGPFSALLCEFLFTFILAKVVLNVAGHSKRENNSFFGLAIGLTVFAGAVAVGGVSGAALNPAVGTGLPMVQGDFSYFWIYWIGPGLGGATAALLFWATNGDEFALEYYMPAMATKLVKDISPYLMEGIGTFFLTMVASMSSSQPLGPLAVGAILIAMVFMSGHVSGSHFNPAVTAAVYSNKAMELKTASFYVLSQLIGALLAGMVSYFLAGYDMGYPTVSSIPAAILMEMLFTFALAITVLHTGKPSDEGTENSYYGLAIGMTVFAGITACGDISGGAFNPALGTALPLFRGEFIYLWIYWLAPLVGGVAAAGVYAITKPDEVYIDLEAERKSKGGE